MTGASRHPPLLIATRSVHKLAEIRRIFADLPLALLGPSDLGLPEKKEEADLEPFDTFALNAVSKAKHFHARSGIPALSDDSGLCVEKLAGGPGVRSRRFAPTEWAERWGRDEANNRWLLERLRGGAGRPRAQYRCAVAVVTETERHVFEGAVQGRIAPQPRGDGGFGYDPLFVPDGFRDTYAELPASVKDATSHRSAALRRAREWIEECMLVEFAGTRRR